MATEEGRKRALTKSFESGTTQYRCGKCTNIVSNIMVRSFKDLNQAANHVQSTPFIFAKAPLTEENGFDIAYHIECLGENCPKCSQLVNKTTPNVVAFDRLWHADCFTCVDCGKKLDEYVDTRNPINENLEPRCTRCITKEIKNFLCQVCNVTIAPHKDAFVIFQRGLFHSQCLKCCECSSPIVNPSQPLTQCIKVNEETSKVVVICQLCYATENMCDHCNRVLSSEYVVLDKKRFHLNCFLCSTCGRILGDDYYTLERRPYCPQCIESMTQNCAFCGKGLSVEGFIRCLGKMYHPECLSCTHCGVQLVQQFFDFQGAPHCERCVVRKRRQQGATTSQSVADMPVHA